MKEDLKHMIKFFDWVGALVAMAFAIAGICFLLGAVLAVAYQNAAWFLLWVPGTMAAAFIGGVCD